MRSEWLAIATMSLSTPAAVTSAPAPGPVTTNGRFEYRSVVIPTLTFEASRRGALEVPKIDESKALAQGDRLMTMEGDVKRTHLGMLIRIRNLLADSQPAKLTELRPKSIH